MLVNHMIVSSSSGDRLRLGHFQRLGLRRVRGGLRLGELSKTGTKKGEGQAKTGGTFKDWD